MDQFAVENIKKRILHSGGEGNDLCNLHVKVARALLIRMVGYVMANNVFAVFPLIFSYNIYSDSRHWRWCK